MDSDSAKVARRPDARWRHTLRGLLLHTATADEPVLVTSPGELVWAELETPKTLDELVAAMARSFDADDATIRADIAVLVDSLLEIDAIEYC